MKKISLTLKMFKKLVEKLRYYKKECKKKDLIIANYRAREEQYNIFFTKDL